jgi:hypothetical protein
VNDKTCAAPARACCVQRFHLLKEAFMRHTVIGVFDTYAQAENARAALMAAGFSHGDIELQANPKRDDAAEPSLEPDVETHAEPGMLANIERFFSMLFGGREQPPEVAHYSEAVRRGAVLVAIDTNSDAQVEIARTTLADQGAIDIDERAASWGTFGHTSAAAAADDRDHSMLDELGLGRGSAVPGRDPVNAPPPSRADASRVRTYPRADIGDPAAEPVLDPLADPLGNPLTRQDPATLSPRDTFTESPAEPLGALDMPAKRDDALSARPAGGIGSTAQRDTLAAGSISERDALAGRDPLSTRTAGSASDLGSTAQRESIARQTLAGSDALGGRDATYQYDPEARRDPLPGTRTDSARDWRPVNPLDDTDASANDSFASRESVSAASASAAGAAGAIPGAAPMGAAGALGPQTVPDEYMEYEDDFRTDYQSKYSATGSAYEDYEGAYRFGATLGNDERFRSRKWDDQMEYELRRDWESRHPEGGDTWDRFKAAIRHGWDRVTGHHHV